MPSSTGKDDQQGVKLSAIAAVTAATANNVSPPNITTRAPTRSTMKPAAVCPEGGNQIKRLASVPELRKRKRLPTTETWREQKLEEVGGAVGEADDADGRRIGLKSPPARRWNCSFG